MATLAAGFVEHQNLKILCYLGFQTMVILDQYWVLIHAVIVFFTDRKLLTADNTVK